MRIEIKRLRGLLNSKADNVMNLETRRLQLQTVTFLTKKQNLENLNFHSIQAIKERRNEISIHQSTLRQQLRDEEGKTGEISAQLHDRITKIEKLKKRYEIVNISMAPPEGVNEEETSQTYYVIKVCRNFEEEKKIYEEFVYSQAAQEKEELQREGDELDAKNRKAEQELLALQNTLRIINSGNHQTKQSFKKLADSSIDLNRIEKKKQNISNFLFFRR